MISGAVNSWLGSGFARKAATGLLAFFGLGAISQDITFNDKVATFTNLQGQVYQHVHLVRGDRDGLIWRDGASGGRICYTNLHPDLLESFGISSNRIEVARVRAEQKAIADARYHAWFLSEARAKLSALNAQAHWTNASPVLSPPEGSADAYGPQADPVAPTMVPVMPYDPGYYYDSSLFWYFPHLPPAPRAPSAPSAPPAPPAPTVLPAPGVPSARSVLPAPPAQSAPPAMVAPGTTRKGR